MMIRNTAAAAAAFLTLAIAGQAAAQQMVTAKLEQPVAERTKLVAGGAVFWCEGAECVASTKTSTCQPAQPARFDSGLHRAAARSGGDDLLLITLFGSFTHYSVSIETFVSSQGLF